MHLILVNLIIDEITSTLTRRKALGEPKLRLSFDTDEIDSCKVLDSQFHAKLNASFSKVQYSSFFSDKTKSVCEFVPLSTDKRLVPEGRNAKNGLK